MVMNVEQRRARELKILQKIKARALRRERLKILAARRQKEWQKYKKQLSKTTKKRVRRAGRRLEAAGRQRTRMNIPVRLRRLKFAPLREEEKIKNRPINILGAKDAFFR